jgi:hypothetical protein|tara:strand:+ start:289 stop:708 length:420 start_codon:yes stop_codon:yes gene_type:complete
MIFIPIYSDSMSFRFDLNKYYENYLIGLVDFQMGALKDPNFIEISCNQIDSTVENPKRILKNIFFNRVNNTSRDKYLSWSNFNIAFYPLDSCINHLELKITKQNGTPFIAKEFMANDPKIILTLALVPIKTKENKWVCI